MGWRFTGAILVLCACGGRAQGPGGPERDDGGACPAAGAPELLLDAPARSYWAYGYPSLVRIDGRGYVVGTGSGSERSTETRFRDVETGEESVLEHEPGFTLCSRVPGMTESVVCSVGQDDGRILSWDLELRSEGSWVAGRSWRLQGQGIPWASAADLEAGRFAVEREDSLEVLDLDGQVELSVPFEGREMHVTVLDDEGRTSAIVTLRSDDDGVSVESRRLEVGAQWQLVHSGPRVAAHVRALHDGSTWYVVRDGGLAAPQTLSLYRSDRGASVLLGSSREPALRDLDSGYTLAYRKLEPGPSAYALGCDASVCTSSRVGFEPFSIETLGTSPIPQDQGAAGLFVVGLAWRECGAADVLLRANEGEFDSGAAVRLWSLHLPGKR